MIKSIRLQNWKSFADATLPVQPLTVLVGTNASGKSNLFEAFSLLKRLVGGFTLPKAFNVEHASFKIRGGDAWAIRKGQVQASISVLLQHPENKSSKLSYQLEFGLDKLERLRLVAEEFSLQDNSGNLLKTIFSAEWPLRKTENEQDENDDRCYLPAADLLYGDNSDDGQLFDYVLKQLNGVSFLAPDPDAMRSYAKIEGTLDVDASNVAGVLVRKFSENGNDIIDRLNQFVRILPDFDLEKIYAEAIMPLKKDAMLYGLERTGNDGREYVVDAGTMSDGTLHFIGIMTALLTVPKGSLLIMEEINQGLHPSRAKDLIEIIKKIITERKIDVMFSTHDPALLDAIGVAFSENIQVVYRNEEGHSDIKCLSDFKMFGKLIGRGSLGKLSTRGELAKAVFQ